MAKTYPKIVLLKENVLQRDHIDVHDYASQAVKSGEPIDALTTMQTDFKPSEKTVQVNREGAFFVANLTETEAKKIEDEPEVEAVVDDEPVHAFATTLTEAAPARAQRTNGNGYAAGMSFDEALALSLDADEQALIEEKIHPDWNKEEEPSPEQLALLCSIDHNGALSSDLEFRLTEQFADGQTSGFEAMGDPELFDEATYAPEQVAALAKEVIGRILRRQNGDLRVTERRIDEVLQSMDLDAMARVRFLRDVVLPNIRLVNAPPAWRYTLGARARLAIVDTGIDPRHPDLRVVGGVSFVPGVSSWADDNRHGTHVAGIAAALMNRRGIVGVAPRAELYAVKVLDRNGSGMKSWVLNGLLWCYRFGMHVVNLSLGSGASTHNPNTFDPAYEHVGRILRRRGIVSVAAAGNNGHQPVGNPARCPSYMAVSAVDYNRRLTTFTNIGPQIEIAAPGLGILSTLPGSRFGRLSGTSMAAPHVAGAAALVKSRRFWLHGDAIRLRLMLTASDLGSAGRDWAFGHGLLNSYQAVQ